MVEQGPARTFTTMNVWDLRLSRDGHVNLTFDEGHTVAMVILRGTVMANADQVVGEGPMGVFDRSTGVVTDMCVAFPVLSALAEDFKVFVVTDASGTFNDMTQKAAWSRMEQAGAQLMTWFGVACELHRDWRNDVEGLGTLFSNHIPDYRNLINSHTLFTSGK